MTVQLNVALENWLLIFISALYFAHFISYSNGCVQAS